MALREIMIVNPSPRPSKRKKKGARKMAKRRSAAQRRATKKMLAARWGRKRKPARRRRRVVASRKRTSRTSTRTVVKYRTRRRNPARRPAARRRNPTLRGVLNTTVMPAVTMAGGALAIDVVMGYADPMLPAALKTGYAANLTKGVMAVITGMVIGKVMKKTALGRDIARGGLTVMLHDMGKTALQDMAPQIPLGDYNGGSYNSYMNGWGSIEGGMGAYVSGDAFADTAAMAPAQQFSVPSDLGAYVDNY